MGSVLHLPEHSSSRHPGGTGMSGVQKTNSPRMNSNQLRALPSNGMIRVAEIIKYPKNCAGFWFRFKAWKGAHSCSMQPFPQRRKLGQKTSKIG